MSANVPAIIKEKYLVTSADTDFTRRLKVSALVNMLIQIAWHHAEILGFGIEFLHRNGLAWMLSRMHLKMGPLPSWNEEIIITSWPKGINRLFYLRDMQVKDHSGKKLADVTTEWLMIDTKSKRPKLYDPENNIFRQNLQRHAIAEFVPVLKADREGNEKFEFTVHYSDIDLNQHLTTTRYVDWMFDTLDTAFLSKNQCAELVLNFLKEIPGKQKVIVSRPLTGSTSDLNFEFSDGSGAHIYFRGLVVF